MSIPARPTEEFISGFEDNILDNFDQVTYNFTFFMVSEENIRLRNVFNLDNRIIIAQSGTTSDVFIEDVEIKNVQGPGRQQRTSTAINFTFTIHEPGGASLLDKIYFSSLDLGIANYFKVPFFLELKFRGRQESNSNVAADTALGKTWVWPIIITKVESEIKSGGSTYSFTAAPYSQLAQTDQCGQIDKPLTVSASTVGGALTAIAQEMNRRQEEKFLTVQTQKDEFIINVDPQIAAMKFFDPAQVDTKSEKAVGTTNATASDNTRTEVTFNSGTSLMRAVESIVSASPDYQKFIKKSKDPEGSESDRSTTETMKQLHRVESDTEILKFDNSRGDYARRYTYNVLPYEMGTLQSDPSETNVSGEVKYDEYKRRKLLQKHYKYIFTGANDQIIDLQLKFNFGWFVNMPMQGAIFSDYVNNIDGAEGRKMPSNYKDYVEIKRKIAQYIGNTPSNVNPDPATARDIEASIKNSELSAEDQESLINVLRRKRNSRIDPEQRTTLLDSTATSTNFSPSARFATDITLEKALSKIKNFSTRDRIIPISYIETLPDDDISNSNAVEQQNRSGRPYVNSMLAQAFSKNQGDLANLTMTIKGDPFWLSPAPFQGIPGHATTIPLKTADVKSYTPTSDSSDGTVSQNFILVTLRTPEEPKEGTGLVEPASTSNTFSGVYGVIFVTNRFSGGLFTQELECVIDPLIKYSEVINKEGRI